MATISSPFDLYIWSIDKINKDKYNINIKIKAYQIHKKRVNKIVWSPNSKYLLTCSHDKQIKCFDGQTGDVVGCYRKHTDPVYGIDWLPDSQHFISSSIDGYLKFWDIKQTNKCEWDLQVFRSAGLIITKNGKFAYIVSGSDSKIAKVDVEKREVVKTLKVQDQICSIVCSTDSKFMIVNSSLKQPVIHLWDLSTDKIIQRFSGFVQSKFRLKSRFNNNGLFIACGSEDGRAVFWHRNQENPITDIKAHDKSVNDIMWHPLDDRLFFTISDDQKLKIWGQENMEIVKDENILLKEIIPTYSMEEEIENGDQSQNDELAMSSDTTNTQDL